MASLSRAKQKSILAAGPKGPKGYLAGTDWLTIALCLAASAFGLLLVYSAVTFRQTPDHFPQKVIVSAAGVVIGLLAAIVMSFIDYELLLRFWYVMAGGCMLLMLLLIPFGVAANPARGDSRLWFELPGNILFQPSELLKLAFIISFTWHLHLLRDRINKLKSIAQLGLHAFIPFAIVVYTGDLGSALVFLVIAGGMLFLAGLKLRWFMALGALGGLSLPFVWIQLINSFQKNRIYAVYMKDFLIAQTSETKYKDIIYQQQQALNAIGSGQLFGKGLFHATVTVPVRDSDMIFSMAGEELGFVGCCAVLLVIAVVVIRLIMVSSRTRNLRARLLCAGVAMMISSQAVINVGMCIKLLPVIGITLPFFSSGGSSNLCLYLAIGLVLTVFRHQNEHEDTQSYFDYLYT
ncbi:MAG: FtsW/RodA/SpoVE family cell cycle protein [Oscillospiraceae bacterium]|nr:FtsW/RodA/SpoVE family cell cycle protein [Oscillospiraceae bacterium]